MHSPVYLAICASAVVSMLCFGAPRLNSMVLASAFAIAVLGVPHGGLDHWTGRRLLQHRFASVWWAVFFPAYLLIGLLFGLSWFVAPTLTVISFFIISAWHFGREDQYAQHGDRPDSLIACLLKHVAAAAVGGLVIWIPAVVRPEEMRSLLSLITFSDGGCAARQIVELTQLIAIGLIPIAMASVVTKLIAAPASWRGWVPIGTVTVAVFTPILVSFSIYFCAWHSWQGLQRLRAQERLSPARFVRCVAPLSIAAIAGVFAVAISMWWMPIESSAWEIANANSISLRATFIGLSAIAVPHLFLHEFEGLSAKSQLQPQVAT